MSDTAVVLSARGVARQFRQGTSTLDVLQGVELESNGAFISSELLIKLKRREIPMVERGVHHYPRTTGISKGATPKVILRTIRDVIRLRLGRPLNPPPAP